MNTNTTHTISGKDLQELIELARTIYSGSGYKVPSAEHDLLYSLNLIRENNEDPVIKSASSTEPVPEQREASPVTTENKTAKSTKTLKLWNGGGFSVKKVGDPLWDGVKQNQAITAYVAAYSQADAQRVIAEYCGRNPPDSELRNYWNKGSWGTRMKDVVPERGMWIEFERGLPPTRVV